MSYDPSGYPPQQPYGQQPPPVVSGPPAPQPYQTPQYAAPQYGAPGGQFPPPPVKKSSPLKILLITAGCVVAGCLVLGGIAVAVGGTGDKTTSSTPKAAGGAAKATGAAEDEPGEEPTAEDGKSFNLPVGATITVADGGDVIEATLRSVKSFKKGCNSLGVDPEQGLYVVLDVVVEQTKGSGSVNPLDFTFVADDGTSNDALSSLFSGCDEPSLDSTDLRAGQKRAGKIAFDVNSKTGTLEWAPGGLGAETVGSWKTK